MASALCSKGTRNLPAPLGRSTRRILIYLIASESFTFPRLLWAAPPRQWPWVLWLIRIYDGYPRGWGKLKEIDWETGEHVVESLKDIAPDFARLLTEFPFGHITTRVGSGIQRNSSGSCSHSFSKRSPSTKSTYSWWSQCWMHWARSYRSNNAKGCVCKFPCCTQWIICSLRGFCWRVQYERPIG